MLWPSTRATWNPNVTMRVAYTAADPSVRTQATSSARTMAQRREAADGRRGRGVAGWGSGATAGCAPAKAPDSPYGPGESRFGDDGLAVGFYSFK